MRLCRQAALLQRLSGHCITIQAKTCRHGHSGPRYTSTGGCVECVSINRKKWQAEDPEKAQRLSRERKRVNAPRINEMRRASYRSNAAEILAKIKQRRADDPERFRKRDRDAYSRSIESILRRKKAWREANAAAIKKRGMEAYWSDPEKHRSQVRAYRIKHKARLRDARVRKYAANKQELSDRSRKWREANRDRVNELQRARRAKDPERAIAHTMRRRARKRGVENSYTAAELRDLWAKSSKKCLVCQTNLTVRSRHVDHIVPLARGGSNAIRNIQFLCGPCNLSKNARDPVEFMQSRGFLL